MGEACPEDLRVFEQYPLFDQKETIFLGDEMRISLRSAVDFDFDSLVFHMLNDTISVDELKQNDLLLNTDLEEF